MAEQRVRYVIDGEDEEPRTLKVWLDNRSDGTVVVKVDDGKDWWNVLVLGTDGTLKRVRGINALGLQTDDEGRIKLAE